MKTYLPTDIKDQNRQVILDLIIQKGRVSKAELSELTNLSFVTTSKIVNFFSEKGILLQSGEVDVGPNGLGRKRAVYEFNANSYFTIGVELIAGRLIALLINLKGEVLESSETVFQVDFLKSAFKENFVKLVSSLCQKADGYRGKVLGIGFAIDGAVDQENQVIRMRADERREREINYAVLKAALEKAVGLPILFENDVNASAVAEFDALGDESLENLITVYLGAGIGSGVILQRELYRGSHSKVGELEYFCFDPDYEPEAGAIGWLETKIGRKTLERKFHLDFEAEGLIGDTRKPTSALAACEYYLKQYLALALVAMITLYDIHRLVLAGKIFKKLSASFKDDLAKRVSDFLSSPIQISLSQVVRPAAVGAALLSLKHEALKIII